MAKRQGPVKDIDDALTWLSFMGRFCDGDLRRNTRGILNVLLRLEQDNHELRERCTALAQRLERLEAANDKGGEGL